MTESEAPARPPGDGKKALGALIGTLGVLVILGAIGALAFSWYVRRQREREVVGLMWSYAEAQVMYHRNDWVGSGTLGVLEYATPYTLLNTQNDNTGTPIDLVDSTFAAARGEDGIPKHGYLFMDMNAIGGVVFNWVDDFGLCATPAYYGRAYRRTFIVCTNGTVFYKDLGESRFVTDYPADPTAAGWVIAE